jgi:serine protease Do
MPLTQLYQQVHQSVVQVLALNGQNPVSFGSGSIISDGKTVLTCEHCIVQGAQMAIANPAVPRQALFGNVIFSDTKADIALLEFQQPIGPAVTLANSSSCAVGNGAFVIGFPMGITEKTLFSAHIASITSTGLRIDASVNHGNSGGPLFNMEGEQIGVVNAKHGSLSQFLTQIKNAQPGAMMSIGGIDPVKAIQGLIAEMQKNLNLGIGYAIKTDDIKPLHNILSTCIP